MGFNLVAGHAASVFSDEAASRITQLLRERFPHSPSISTSEETFVVPDELGWSFWSELQALAREKLGESGSVQIRAIDAWCGVYIAGDVEREVLWPDGKPSAPVAEAKPSGGVWASIKGLFKGRTDSRVPTEVEKVMAKMVASYGARPGESKALQVGSLNGLMAELDALLAVLNVQSNEAAVGSLLNQYLNDDNRVDDDPAIQCLCHAWLTARFAIERNVPLWLVK